MMETGKRALAIACLMKDRCHRCDMARAERHFLVTLRVPNIERAECIACIESATHNQKGLENGTDTRNV